MPMIDIALALLDVTEARAAWEAAVAATPDDDTNMTAGEYQRLLDACDEAQRNFYQATSSLTYWVQAAIERAEAKGYARALRLTGYPFNRPPHQVQVWRPL